MGCSYAVIYHLIQHHWKLCSNPVTWNCPAIQVFCFREIITGTRLSSGSHAPIWARDIIQFFNFLWKTLILHWLLVLRILPNKPVTWIFKWWHWDCVLCAEGLCEASWSARVLIEESVPQGSKTQSHFCYTSVPTSVWWATWRVIVLLGRSLVSHQKGQNPGLQQEALCSSQINGI